MELQTTIHIILRWILVAISLSAATCAIYAFIKVFVHNRIKRIIFTGIVVALCVFWYIEAHKSPDVVYMRENTLYILPKTE